MTVHVVSIDPHYLTREWAAIRNKVVARDKEMCQYCGLKGFQADHVIPRSHGGPDAMTNLVCCCDRCNALLKSKFFWCLGEKKRWVQCTLSGRPFRDRFPQPCPDKSIPQKFNGMTPEQLRQYFEARKERTRIRQEWEDNAHLY